MTQIENNEWMNYTVKVPEAKTYTVYITYRAKASFTLFVATDQGRETRRATLPVCEQWQEKKLGSLPLSAGACVLRLCIEKAGQELEIIGITVK